MKYDDILYKERPIPKRPMSLNDRAKIFLPFAALKGFDDLIDQKNKKEITKIELSQDALEELDDKIHYLLDNLPIRVSIIYYEDKQYKTLIGFCSKIDLDRNLIKIEDTSISLQTIYDIEM